MKSYLVILGLLVVYGLPLRAKTTTRTTTTRTTTTRTTTTRTTTPNNCEKKFRLSPYATLPPAINESIFNGKNLACLEEVSLYKKGIRSIADTTFSGLTGLKVLDLSGNYLEPITNKPFQNLTNLEELNLSENNLTSLSTGIFLNLSKLRKLDLIDNKLTTLNISEFPENIIYNQYAEVNLTMNFLDTLDRSPFPPMFIF